MFNFIKNFDPEIYNSMRNELNRQKYKIELIASENIVSRAVMQANGSIFTNKYAEGYPGKRYYGGCIFMDEVEQLAINRICKLFGTKFANVQPHSGASANLAVYNAFLNPGDVILGMSLPAGGHLTHGANKTISGSWFQAIQYGIRDDNGLIDYDQVRDLAIKHKPKMIISGTSSYPRIIHWDKFKKIADEIGAILLADISHVSGLVASGCYPSPVPFADIITSTTHKTLRGPRGGVILTNNEDFIKKINSSVFPGLQSGPLMHVIAAKAISFKEALQDDFKIYSQNIVKNAKILAKILVDRGLKITTGGTDCHLIVADLTPLENLTGKEAEKCLERAGLTCNKNAIPNDPRSPFITSGLRFGTAAGTTRGFGKEEFAKIGHLICDTLESFVKNNLSEEKNQDFEKKVASEVKDLCLKFPIYE